MTGPDLTKLSDDELASRLRNEVDDRLTNEANGYPIKGGHAVLVKLADEYMRRHGDV
jgi:hypothetical protein